MITNLGNIQLTDSRLLQAVGAKFSHTFATHDKAMNKPSRQRLGANLAEWRLSIRLHYQFCDPASVFEKLQNVLNAGLPVALVFDYLDYVGYVTLDELDVSFSQVADNGRPLIIDGNITLTEFSGDPSIKPPAPAVQNLSNLTTPISTAQTLDVSTLLPTATPLQNLEKSLIAQHRAKHLLRVGKDMLNGDFTGVNQAIAVANQALTDFDEADLWTAIPTTLPSVHQGNAQAVLQQFDRQKVQSATLAKQATLRQLRGR